MIETERLILRQMKHEDMEAYLDIFTDPETMKYFGVVFDRGQMEGWIERNLEHQKKHGFSLLTVVLKENNEIIGDCGLETDEIEGKLTVGLGYDFKRKYWNRGYATEAGKAVVEYGFGTFDFDKISGWANPENGPSIRVAEKIGFTRGKSILRGGKEYLLLSISKATWLRLKS